VKLALSFLQHSWLWYAKAQLRRDGVWIPRPPVFEEGEWESIQLKYGIQPSYPMDCK